MDSGHPTGATFIWPVGEEQATTKSFPIHESMAAEGVGSDSMLLSLAIANRKLQTAQGEISVNRFTVKVRIKKVTVLNRKEYLIGLECERKARSATRQ